MPSFGFHPAIDPSVLGCILTGFAKGGTTLLKDILVETTDLVGQFEGGLLMAESPADGIPEPYAANLQEAWNTQPRFGDRYRRCETFEQGYRLLRRSSRALAAKDAPLIDKLPQYLVHLDDVMRRAPGTPVVVVVRNPVHVAVSWLDLGNPLEPTLAWLAAAADSLLTMLDRRHRLSPLYLVNFADLVNDPNAAIRPLHAWLGRPHRRMRPNTRCGLPYVQSGREALPLGIEHDRHDMRRRCPAERLSEIQRAVSTTLPDVSRLMAIQSGPADRSGGEQRRAA